MEQRSVSTTALAKALQMSSRRLFLLLKDYEWIHRVDAGWELLKKGTEQGGEYRESESFGRYIVWPEKLLEHPLLLAAADATQMTASGIGDHFGRSARLTNRVLRELGWIRHTSTGWLLTDAGTALGASQLQTEQGKFYASWPRSLLSEPELVSHFNAINILQHRRQDHEPDLFESENTTELSGSVCITSLDGHILATAAEAELCQWLYLLDLNHAYRRDLGGHDLYKCDFYLPKYGLYIDIWYASDPPGILSERLAKQQWCNEHQLTLLELDENDISQLDYVLPQRLGELGIQVY
ncbi:MAG: hypothetical protein AAF542_09720 [Pseudomonadota bacterium]